jgi:hypothetical protein
LETSSSSNCAADRDQNDGSDKTGDQIAEPTGERHTKKAKEAQAERFIAQCQNRIARQHEIIASAYENDLPTDIPESMVRALEEGLRALEKHRQLILDRMRDRERQ